MSQWKTVCPLTDIAPNTGVCALHQGEQVALFRRGADDAVYAISNYDPIGKANVLSRGLIGSIKDRVVVASPLYKQHFDLSTGECLEQPESTIKTYPVRVENGQIELG
ncbi:MAG: nitrite reductase small subunit NirD [Oceanobacter sp.]